MLVVLLFGEVNDDLVFALTEQLIPSEVVEANILGAAYQDAFSHHSFSPVVALLDHGSVLVVFD